MPASSVLALDVGEKRVGVALARAEVRVPVVLKTLDRKNENFWDRLVQICHDNDIAEIVVGLPRGLDGQDTEQTNRTREFVSELKNRLNLPVVLQDEALTSHKAKENLSASGKSYDKSDIDGLAASYILDDYLSAERAHS